MKTLPVLLTAIALLHGQEPPTVTFGTTVTSSSGLRGQVYLIQEGTGYLPNFKRLQPVGSIYTTSLRITPRAFDRGFPGITDRFEWFAIDYTGKIWIETEGRYAFRLLSDDGAKLYINGSLLIDNDGIHMPEAITGSGHLTRGVHTIRVSYFQGPRILVALVLDVAGPDNTQLWRNFNTNDFQPPPDPADWVPGKVSKVKRGENW